MNLSNNEKVDNFLKDLKAIDNQMYDIVMEIREIIFKTHQPVEEKIMYGGIVFFFDTEMFSGVFAYKNHVSLEFSKGFQMNDPNHHLEGKGKYRRHLKILTNADIINKEVASYVKQAV